MGTLFYWAQIDRRLPRLTYKETIHATRGNIVSSDNFKVAMVVNELMAQQQVVIKSLEKNYKRIEGVSGATILGDGTVALIIDAAGVVKLAGAEKLHQQCLLRKTG